MNKNLVRAAVIALLATSPLLLPAPARAQASTEARQLDIPAGPLGAAVARLGRELGIIVTVDPALVRGTRGNGLSGRYSPAAAFDALLAGTGLAAQPDGRGGYRVVNQPAGERDRPSGSAPSGAMAEVLLDELVVVGALTRVEVDAAELELRQAADLADIFRGTPSVSVGGSLGIAQKIYVRGLEDTQLNVTVDGAPQHGTLFHHVGRVAIEPELLKTVDVQTGAGEATAGFGAIGGAIRFRTRDAVDLLAPGKAFGGLARASWLSNDGHRLSGSLYGRLAGELGFVASYVHTDRDDMKDGAGNRLYGTAGEQRMGFLKLGGQITPDQRLSLSFEQREEEASFGQRPNWPAMEGDTLYPVTGRRRTGVLNHGIALTGALDLESTFYWTQSKFTQDIFDRWGVYGAAILTRGLDLRTRFARGAHEAVVGVEYRDDVVHSGGVPRTADDHYIEKGNVAGIYAQDHWQLTDALLLSYGARFDRYRLKQVTYDDGTDSRGFSGNIGLRYRLTDAVTLHASFAEAFRGKEIGDAFTLWRAADRISLSPTLQPERVDNHEAGVSFAQGGWHGSAVYYHTRIKDVILDQLGAGPAPQNGNYFENVGSLKARGIELRGGFATGPWSVDAHFNHSRTRLNGNLVEGYEHIGLGNSVGDNWGLTTGFRPARNWTLEAAVTRFNALNDIEVLHRAVQVGWIDSTRHIDKPGYTVVDLFGQWRPFRNERIVAGVAVYNLFDKHYRAHASVGDYGAVPGWEGVAGVMEPGRNVRLTLSTSF